METNTQYQMERSVKERIIHNNKSETAKHHIYEKGFKKTVFVWIFCPDKESGRV